MIDYSRPINSREEAKEIISSLQHTYFWWRLEEYDFKLYLARSIMFKGFEKQADQMPEDNPHPYENRICEAEINQMYQCADVFNQNFESVRNFLTEKIDWKLFDLIFDDIISVSCVIDIVTYRMDKRFTLQHKIFAEYRESLLKLIRPMNQIAYAYYLNDQEKFFNSWQEAFRRVSHQNFYPIVADSSNTICRFFKGKSRNERIDKASYFLREASLLNKSCDIAHLAVDYVLNGDMYENKIRKELYTELINRGFELSDQSGWNRVIRDRLKEERQHSN